MPTGRPEPGTEGIEWDAWEELDETWWFFLRVLFWCVAGATPLRHGRIRVQIPAACVNCKTILRASRH